MHQVDQEFGILFSEIAPANLRQCSPRKRQIPSYAPRRNAFGISSQAEIRLRAPPASAEGPLLGEGDLDVSDGWESDRREAGCDGCDAPKFLVAETRISLAFVKALYRQG